MIDTERPQKLGPNVSSFERHIAVGLEAAGLNIEDFFPVYMSHTEDKSKGVGFGIRQARNISTAYQE